MSLLVSSYEHFTFSVWFYCICQNKWFQIQMKQTEVNGQYLAWVVFRHVDLSHVMQFDVAFTMRGNWLTLKMTLTPIYHGFSLPGVTFHRKGFPRTFVLVRCLWLVLCKALSDLCLAPVITKGMNVRIILALEWAPDLPENLALTAGCFFKKKKTLALKKTTGAAGTRPRTADTKPTENTRFIFLPSAFHGLALCGSSGGRNILSQLRLSQQLLVVSATGSWLC